MNGALGQGPFANSMVSYGVLTLGLARAPLIYTASHISGKFFEKVVLWDGIITVWFL